MRSFVIVILIVAGVYYFRPLERSLFGPDPVESVGVLYLHADW
jgi:hypothetical protein